MAAAIQHIPVSHPCWEHIDQIYPEGKNQLQTTIEGLEAIRRALMAKTPIDAQSLVRLCDHALIDVRAAEGRLGNAVILMNGEDLED